MQMFKHFKMWHTIPFTSSRTNSTERDPLDHFIRSGTHNKDVVGQGFLRKMLSSCAPVRKWLVDYSVEENYFPGPDFTWFKDLMWWYFSNKNKQADKLKLDSQLWSAITRHPQFRFNWFRRHSESVSKALYSRGVLLFVFHK